MDKVSTFLADEALEGVLLAQKTYQLKYEARMNELGSELEEGEEDEDEDVQDEQSQEGESDRETRLRILEVESASQKAGSCGKEENEDMRQHPY